ncbi:hypothetical protein J6590_040329 [Homalodisca vitripennis]|nr:hypothetical protein J6590_040329 [Homalodisca vitripennis]
MDTETCILSVRERSAVWDQQQSSHHNRFILDRMWKEIGQENNFTVKEAQQKWKGLRDYYRSEFRKTQKERSGQGADTVYKPNWPYFMSLDFLREQFQVRPSSGNITLSEHRSEKKESSSNRNNRGSNWRRGSRGGRGSSGRSPRPDGRGNADNLLKSVVGGCTQAKLLLRKKKIGSRMFFHKMSLRLLQSVAVLPAGKFHVAAYKGDVPSPPKSWLRWRLLPSLFLTHCIPPLEALRALEALS